MKLATWNVNSLKVRLPHVLDWLAAQQPDVLCLQETKLEDKNFPIDEIRAAGYFATISGQKTYNGVAILSKELGKDAVTAIPNFADEQKRVLALTFASLRVICAYVPNGQEVGSDKYKYKLSWLAAFSDWVRDELVAYPDLALAGDFNVAPEDRDVFDPKACEGQVLVSADERDAFKKLIDLGLSDSFRLFHQPEKSFSWWDYRMQAFRRNMGLRIDHVLLSASLRKRCQSCLIDKSVRKLDRPSDHAPVMVELIRQ
jgi:exodeoxyribonuclease III